MVRSGLVRDGADAKTRGAGAENWARGAQASDRTDRGNVNVESETKDGGRVS